MNYILIEKNGTFEIIEKQSNSLVITLNAKNINSAIFEFHHIDDSIICKGSELRDVDGKFLERKGKKALHEHRLDMDTDLVDWTKKSQDTIRKISRAKLPSEIKK